MASAAEMLRRLKSVSKITTLREMVYEEIMKEEQILLDLKEEEYEEGNIRSNKSTSMYKNQDYADEKHEMNPRAGYSIVDLMYTGAFINSFKINKPKANRYIFGATDPKKNKLIKKYGDIMGLKQQTFEDFQVVIIKPRFIKKLQQVINAKV